jgi:hypothetical protein
MHALTIVFREAIAAGVMRFTYVKSAENCAGCLTKELGNDAFIRSFNAISFALQET